MAHLITISAVQDVTSQLRDVKSPPIPSKDGFIAAKLSSLLLLKPDRLKNIRLAEHLRPIVSVTLSADQNHLVSCSSDKVILWRTNALSNSGERGDPVRGTTIGVHLGPINQCSLSCSKEWLALSKEREIWIIRLKWQPTGEVAEVEHHSIIPGVSHFGFGSFSSFSPDDPDVLVVVEDSNVFKLWNVRVRGSRSERVHQGSILGSHRISFCAFSSSPAWGSSLLVGSNRGVVHIFRLKAPQPRTYPPRLLLAVDLVRPKNTSLSTGDSSPSRNENRRRTQDENASEAGCIVLNAILVHSTDASGTKHDDEFPHGFSNGSSTIRSILKPGPVLIACSNLGIAVYSVNAGEHLCFLSLAELSTGSIESPIPCLDYGVLSGCSTERVHCVLRAVGGKAYYFMFSVQSKQSSTDAAPISMLARNPVSSKSALRVQIEPSAAPSACAIYSPAWNKPRSKLERKIRSSGYGLPPRNLDFTPRINSVADLKKSLSQVANAKDKQTLVNVRSSRCVLPDQDSHHLKSWKPPLNLKSKLFFQEQYGAALHLGITGDGNQLACSSKKLITVLNANKVSWEDSVSLIGHDSGINSVAFSVDNTWLVSASDDGSTKIWDWKTKRCVVDIRSDKETLGPNTKKGARCKVTQASFYYMDRFVIQAVGSHLDLCSHRLHEDGPKVPRSAWRRIRRIELPAQEVTCFSAANRFHSNYLVAGSSNRSLLAYDVDAEKLVLNLSGAHERPPHALCAFTGSSRIAHPARILDLLLSTALCDGVKLWDLRTARCVQKYSSHSNRAHLSGVDVSPCCRYVAVASEDKCVYLYDSRQCHDYLCKLNGFGVPVMDVLFSPSRAQLFAAGLNGSVLSFSADNKDRK